MSTTFTKNNVEIPFALADEMLTDLHWSEPTDLFIKSTPFGEVSMMVLSSTGSRTLLIAVRNGDVINHTTVDHDVLYEQVRAWRRASTGVLVTT